MGKKLLLTGVLAAAFAIPAGYMANEKFNLVDGFEPKKEKLVEYFQQADKGFENQFSDVESMYQSYRKAEMSWYDARKNKADKTEIKALRSSKNTSLKELKAGVTSFVAKLTLQANATEYKKYASQMESMQDVVKFSRIKFNSSWAPAIENCAQQSAERHNKEASKAKIIARCAKKSI